MEPFSNSIQVNTELKFFFLTISRLHLGETASNTNLFLVFVTLKPDG